MPGACTGGCGEGDTRRGVAPCMCGLRLAAFTRENRPVHRMTRAPIRLGFWGRIRSGTAYSRHGVRE